MPRSSWRSIADTLRSDAFALQALRTRRHLIRIEVNLAQIEAVAQREQRVLDRQLEIERLIGD